MRLDQQLLERGLCESREKAQRAILAGQVRINGQMSDKPGRKVKPDDTLELLAGERYVSRGGFKLEGALQEFSIDPTGLRALDIGASTGGFTDCLLQHGAAKVYAVDVGKAQLHERLRTDPRVVALEGVNLRLVGPDFLPEPVDMLVADVSFISLTLVLEPCVAFLKPSGLVAALIKPQFEVGPGNTVKGVVTDEGLRREAVEKVLAFAAGLGLESLGVVPSAIKGPKGNQEYMAVWRKRG
jgi:23S rRNA (cytidine1920-2'-O)/16S rRNA (cytidine1409-2'-O)-methyltransferase